MTLVIEGIYIPTLIPVVALSAVEGAHVQVLPAQLFASPLPIVAYRVSPVNIHEVTVSVVSWAVPRVTSCGCVIALSMPNKPSKA